MSREHDWLLPRRYARPTTPAPAIRLVTQTRYKPDMGPTLRNLGKINYANGAGYPTTYPNHHL
jgi:hypothetical protein